LNALVFPILSHPFTIFFSMPCICFCAQCNHSQMQRFKLVIVSIHGFWSSLICCLMLWYFNLVELYLECML
jgi:hypothetical protein